MTQVTALVAAKSDVGRARANNEDAYALLDLSRWVRIEAEPPSGTVDIGDQGLLLALSDGMGGHQAGEVASAMVVDSLCAALRVGSDEPIASRIDAAVRGANAEVFRAARMGNKRGMGATLTALLIRRDETYLAQVGDSRAYLLRDGQLRQLSRDQSLIQLLLDGGMISAENDRGGEDNLTAIVALRRKWTGAASAYRHGRARSRGAAGSHTTTESHARERDATGRERAHRPAGTSCSAARRSAAAVAHLPSSRWRAHRCPRCRGCGLPLAPRLNPSAMNPRSLLRMGRSGHFALAPALAMAALTMAIVTGLTLTRLTGRNVFRLALHFGLSQAQMPTLRWFAGTSVPKHIASIDQLSSFGHPAPVATVFPSTGLFLGHRLGTAWGRREATLGGLNLINIGVKTVVEHHHIEPRTLSARHHETCAQ